MSRKYSKQLLDMGSVSGLAAATMNRSPSQKTYGDRIRNITKQMSEIQQETDATPQRVPMSPNRHSQSVFNDQTPGEVRQVLPLEPSTVQRNSGEASPDSPSKQIFGPILTLPLNRDASTLQFSQGSPDKIGGDSKAHQWSPVSPEKHGESMNARLKMYKSNDIHSKKVSQILQRRPADSLGNSFTVQSGKVQLKEGIRTQGR